MTDQELQELIKLKRYEQPEEGYFDDFLTEFQDRQRSEILKVSSRSLFVERVKTWFDFSQGASKLVLGAGGVCAACAVVAITLNQLPKMQKQQHLANQIDALPTDVAEISSDTLMLKMKESSQVSSELIREQLEPIDFTNTKNSGRPVFSTDQIVF